jgi:hypothetical protein
MGVGGSILAAIYFIFVAREYMISYSRLDGPVAVILKCIKDELIAYESIISIISIIIILILMYTFSINTELIDNIIEDISVLL